MFVDPHAFILRWGYLGLFFSSLIESEPIVICISFFCKSLNFNIFFIFFLSFLGTFIGSLFLFLLGRFFGAWLKRFQSFSSYIEKVNPFIDSYGILFILMFRFIYGVKLISPIIIGVSNIPFNLFFFMNILGSVIWAFFMVMIGLLVSYFIMDFSLSLILYVYVATIVIPFLLVIFYRFFYARFK